MIYVVVLLSTKWQVDYFHSVEAVRASFCHLFQSIKNYNYGPNESSLAL